MEKKTSKSVLRGSERSNGKCILFFSDAALEQCIANKTAVAVVSGHVQTQRTILVSHLLDLQVIFCQIKLEL